jgi:hypothetical protein
MNGPVVVKKAPRHGVLAVGVLLILSLFCFGVGTTGAAYSDHEYGWLNATAAIKPNYYNLQISPDAQPGTWRDTSISGQISDNGTMAGKQFEYFGSKDRVQAPLELAPMSQPLIPGNMQRYALASVYIRNQDFRPMESPNSGLKVRLRNADGRPNTLLQAANYLVWADNRTIAEFPQGAWFDNNDDIYGISFTYSQFAAGLTLASRDPAAQPPTMTPGDVIHLFVLIWLPDQGSPAANAAVSGSGATPLISFEGESRLP